MKKVEVANYLDRLVQSHIVGLRSKEKTYQEYGIEIYKDKDIHVLEGIERLADAADIFLDIERIDMNEFKYMFSFEHNGIKIFQLNENDELPEVVWDE